MEFGENSAIYLQIADQLCERILLGKLLPGDRIPSVRELAVSIEVNPNTVLRAFNYLQEKGIINNRRGIGYFVTEDGLQKINGLRREAFISGKLPELFKEMGLLNLTLEDIREFYRQYVENTDTQP